MFIREPLEVERDKFDAVATHPMQSWAWGEFRKATGVEVVRLALFDGPKLTKSFQITIHTVPKLNFKIGYFPKGSVPDEAQIYALKTASEQHKLIFIKNEPNFYAPNGTSSEQLQLARKFLEANLHKSGRPMFTPYSFVLDINKSEDELLKNMKDKTRYNIRVAQKHGVQIIEDNSESSFEEYLKLLKETTKRQEFYAHTADYHRKMWTAMREAGIAHLLKAVYQGQTLGIWILFIFNKVLYYPYGASSRENRQVMANNLLAWEAIKFGQKYGCKLFDMWGSLGPNPDQNDPWYGFHRFKEGYGGNLMEFVGSYDYITDPQKYQIYRLVDNWRWKFLKFRAKLPI
jgi:lipid II:glycine glycyltransferase (peptidoglycan interpeptide bridge formation enzyme)